MTMILEEISDHLREFADSLPKEKNSAAVWLERMDLDADTIDVFVMLRISSIFLTGTSLGRHPMDIMSACYIDALITGWILANKEEILNER